MQRIYTLSQIEIIAQEIISKAVSNILLFNGEMGSGKTTLIKSILKQLGVKEVISSPTFSIVNEYISTTNKQIYHFDCYRLEHQEEALDLGFEEYIYTGDWVFIEWPEKISSLIPHKTHTITIKTIDEETRSIVLQ